MKKVVVSMLLSSVVFSVAAIGDVLVLEQGKSALWSDGSKTIIAKIEAQNGDLKWDVGESFVMSFDFVVSEPMWYRNKVGWVVGVGDEKVNLGFGARYESARSMSWNGNVDANASRGIGKLRIEIIKGSDRVRISKINSTSADLRDDGDAAHFVFIATRDSATQYTLHMKWFTMDRTVFDEMTVVRDEGKAVETCSNFLFKINSDSKTDSFEINNLMMKLVPAADAHKIELPLEKVSEPEAIGLLAM